jgi:hypothetical protein
MIRYSNESNMIHIVTSKKMRDYSVTPGSFIRA